MRVPLLFALCLLWLALASATPASLVSKASKLPVPASCKGELNERPVVSFDLDKATPLAATTNGTLYQVLGHNSTTPLMVLHVYGDPYSQGVAYGELLQSRLVDMVPGAYAYFSEQFGVDAETVRVMLDVTRNTTEAFTHPHHFEFLRGISAGTRGSFSFEEMWRMAVIPELIKASCSIVGAWGSATKSGDLIELRALDWGTTGPFQQWPVLTTFHPDDDTFTYTTMGWAGLYGALTGWSESGLVISQKVWGEYDKLQNVFGYPWTFMLQDMLRFDMDIDRALSRLAQSVRTCAIWLGLGQTQRPNPYRPGHMVPADFRLVGDSFEIINIWNPDNFPYYPNHDYFESLLFVNKHWQPSSKACMNDYFHLRHGQLTAEDMFQGITGLDETGDMHIAVMDGASKVMYVSNAAPMPDNVPAYARGFIRLDMKSLWSRPRKNTGPAADFTPTPAAQEQQPTPQAIEEAKQAIQRVKVALA